jgi:D-alanyl-lipoteichoic acid acyltransferase DltB (MBOAT superfamily)
VFYGYWDIKLLSLIFTSTFVDFWISKKIESSSSRVTQKRFLILSIIANLGVLSFFKYCNFFMYSFLVVINPFGAPPSYFLDIILPVGISFYTFQTMAYTIDVYRGKIKAERNFFQFALFVTYFPQLVAGPIERASHLMPQLRSLNKPTSEQVLLGINQIIWGFFLKVFIADNLAVIVDEGYLRFNSMTSIDTLFIVLAFTLQIYADFSGYSKIARGISNLIGIDLMKNFWHPFLASNPSDFWHRWHISLSTWLKDYLYISLGGNRNNKTYRNLMLTMILGGLWHGASGIFILWGFYQGSLLIAHRKWKEKSLKFFQLEPLNKILMFCFGMYGWLIFRSENLLQVKTLSKSLLNFTKAQVVTKPQAILIASMLVVILVYDIYEERQQKEVSYNPNSICSNIFIFILLMLTIFLGAPSNGFIYFQF